jgi:hypothetical protein
VGRGREIAGPGVEQRVKYQVGWRCFHVDTP